MSVSKDLRRPLLLKQCEGCSQQGPIGRYDCACSEQTSDRIYLLGLMASHLEG
jgi:hypothetical protein